ncbi:MAG: AMP-dependent synthetase/ligase [Bacteroidales bacterium]
MNKRITADNLAMLYQKAAEKFNGLPAFATRKSALNWHPVSYSELYRMGLELATGLIELGVKSREHVGLFGDNRMEWILADYAVQISGAADVPRGRDVSDAELSYIIHHAEIEVAFAETEALQNRILELKSHFPRLRQVILMEDKATPAPGVLKLSQVLETGRRLREKGDRRAEARMENIQPDDLFTLIYTSGTTGIPKGVMLTHANMMSQVRNLPGIHDCTDRMLSVLPIWHIFERVIEMYTISFGGCTFYSSIQTLGDDLRNVEPTFMASAPRLWEKLYERIIRGVKASHPVRQMLFHIGYFLARQYKESTWFITNSYLKLKPHNWFQHIALLPFHLLRWAIVLPWYGFFNAAVLERIRLGAGGALRMTISGGGALPSQIDKFFNYVGIPILEGYGMTETCPVISTRSMVDRVIGTVGPPIKETDIKIVDPETSQVLFPDQSLPDLGRSRKGEIWVKGPQVMKGYYKEPRLTSQVMEDGWMKTGDMGTITHNNHLKIMGRHKSTIVLSSGENVEPEPIEMRLQQSQLIDQCMIVGQDEKFLSALIVPGISEFKTRGYSVNTAAELVANPEAQKLIRDEIRKLTSTSNGFKLYEQIKSFRILPEVFQVGDELTNLHKIKRHVIMKKYDHIIKDLFTNGSPKKNGKNGI